jgi:hypothetical protein
MSPVNLKAPTANMDLQRLLTLPGYSWRTKRYEGDKGGVDGIAVEFTWLLTTHV